MFIDKIISCDRVVCLNYANSKKSVIETVSQLFADTNPTLTKTELFDAYIKRERLGSTGLGNGIAIPHIRHSGIDKAAACVIRLAKGVDFAATDKYPVDLIIGLLVPDNETNLHLSILAEVARLVSCKEYRKQLRAAPTSRMLYQQLLTLSHAEVA